MSWLGHNLRRSRDWLLVLRMRFAMWLRWLLSSQNVRHIMPRGFLTDTESWHRGLPLEDTEGARFIVIRHQTSLALVEPVAIGNYAQTLRPEPRQIECPHLFVVSVPDGSVHDVTGDVMDRSGMILTELSLMRPRHVRPWVYEMHRPFRPRRTEQGPVDLGTSCTVVSQYASGNYFHWMLNSLPRFALFQQAGIEVTELDTVVTNELVHAFQLETLARVGVHGSRVVEAGTGFFGKADLLYATRSLRAAGH
ncbi:MAG: hypothetical protein R3178_05070, partial [Rhodothermales bacterium]|nr:hypothetical protein [Rhodothermales bacterium]